MDKEWNTVEDYEGILEIRVKISGDVLEKYRKIKNASGLVFDSEVMRRLIVNEYDREIERRVPA